MLPEDESFISDQYKTEGFFLSKCSQSNRFLIVGLHNRDEQKKNVSDSIILFDMQKQGKLTMNGFNAIRAVCFSGNEQYFAISSQKKPLGCYKTNIFHIRDNIVTKRLCLKYSSPVYAIDVSTNNSYVAIAVKNNKIFIMNSMEHKDRSFIQLEKDHYTAAVCLNDNGSTLVIGLSQGALLMYQRLKRISAIASNEYSNTY